jgi:hypothetical protein
VQPLEEALPTYHVLAGFPASCQGGVRPSVPRLHWPLYCTAVGGQGGRLTPHRHALRRRLSISVWCLHKCRTAASWVQSQLPLSAARELCLSTTRPSRLTTVWAQVSRRIVSNESADILHMFNDLSVGGSGRLDTPLEGLTGVDLRPPGLLQQVVVAIVCLAMCRGGGDVRLVLWSPTIASV